jgi:hypothetical protein
MHDPTQEGPRRDHDRPRQKQFSTGKKKALNPAIPHQELGSLFLNHRQIARRADAFLHRSPVKSAVRLSSRSANSCALGAIQQTKLYSGGVRDAAHETIKCINLSYKMALAQPSDGRVAGHHANCGKAVGDKSGSSTDARRRRRGFTSGVAAAYNHDIE